MLCESCRTVAYRLSLEFHGTSFPRSILVTSSRLPDWSAGGLLRCSAVRLSVCRCRFPREHLQQVVRVVLVDFGERHRLTVRRAALHRIRPPADQSGKRVASWTGKSPDTPDANDLLWTSSLGCHDDATAENGPVEFKLYAALFSEPRYGTTWRLFSAISA